MKKLVLLVLFLVAVLPAYAQDDPSGCIVSPPGERRLGYLMPVTPSPAPPGCIHTRNNRPMTDRCFDDLIDLVPPKTGSVAHAPTAPSVHDIGVHSYDPPILLTAGQEGPQPQPGEEKTTVKYDPDWHASIYVGYSLLYDTEPSSGISGGVAFRLSQLFDFRADFWTIRTPNARVLMLGPEFRPTLPRPFFEPFFNIKAGAIRNDTINWGTYGATGCGKKGPCPGPGNPLHIKGQPFADEEHQTTPALSVGAGADLRLHRYLFIRLADANYVIGRVYRDGLNNQEFLNHFQLATGVGIRF
jgi:hypothetical protein